MIKGRKILIWLLLIGGLVYMYISLPPTVPMQKMALKASAIAAYEAENPLSIECQAATIINQDNGDILYAKNDTMRLYPASVTKILTALLAIENGDLDEMVTVGEEIQRVSPFATRAWLQQGQALSLRDLIYALMLPSGNDAAYTIAVHIARKNSSPSLDTDEAVEVFVDLMNRRAQQLGARDSHFVNPDGFHDPNHYSSARDLSIIAREAMKDPFFQQVVRTTKYGTWTNSNQLIAPDSSYYLPCATGLKTGFTTPAGHCLISSACDNDVQIIAVALNSSKDGIWKDSRALLSYGFAASQAITDYQEQFLDTVIRKGMRYAGLIVILLLYISYRLYRIRKR